MVKHLQAKHRCYFPLCGSPGRSEAVKIRSGQNSGWSASDFTFMCSCTFLHLVLLLCCSIAMLVRGSIIILVFQSCVSTFSGSGIQGKRVWPRLLDALLKHKHIQAESRLGEGESAFNKVPRGVVRKAPDKSLTAWGRAETSAPFLYQRLRLDTVAASGQSSTHSCEPQEDDKDLNQHGWEPALCMHSTFQPSTAVLHCCLQYSSETIGLNIV